MDTRTPPPLPGKKMKPFDLIGFIRKRSLFILLASGLLLAALLPLVWLKSRPYFQTNGNLIISPEIKQLLSRDGDTITGSLRDFANTQIHRLKTEEVLSDALYQLPRDQWPAMLDGLSGFDAAVSVLKRRLNVAHVPRTYVLHLSLNDADARGLAEMINAVMDAYIEKLQTEQEDLSHRRLLFIADEREKVIRSMNELKEQCATLSEKLQSHSFVDNQNLSYDYLVQVQESLARARALALEHKSLQEMAEGREDDLRIPMLETRAEEAVFKNEAVYLIKNWTYQQLQGMRASIDGLTETNPERVYVENRMEAMEDYLKAFEGDLYETSLGILERRRRDDLALEAQETSDQYEASRRVIADLEAEVNAASATFMANSELISLGKDAQRSLARLDERLLFLNNLLSEVSLEAKAPLRVSIEESARAPLGPAGNNRAKLLLMAMMLALGLPVAIGLGFELIDERILRLPDVEAAIGGPVLGMLPKGASTDSTRLQEFAVRLQREHERNGSRVFAFTAAEAPRPGSTLAPDMAEALAKLTGSAILLTSRPLKDPVAKAVQVEAMRDAGNPKALREQVGALRKDHPVVILDLEPISESVTSQFVASQVDVLILNAWRKKTTYGGLRSAFAKTHQAAPAVVSAILHDGVKSDLDQLMALKRSLADGLLALKRWRPSLGSIRRGLGRKSSNPKPSVSGPPQVSGV